MAVLPRLILPLAFATLGVESRSFVRTEQGGQDLGRRDSRAAEHWRGRNRVPHQELERLHRLLYGAKAEVALEAQHALQELRGAAGGRILKATENDEAISELMVRTAAAGAFPPPPMDHTTDLFLPIRHECNHTAVEAYLLKNPQETKRTKRQQQTENNLVLLHKIFASHGLPVILESGTLLGFYRDCAVIPHDMDGDIGVFAAWLKGKAAPSELKKSFDAVGGKLDEDFCPKGPGYNGCQMRVTFKDRSYVDIIVYATDLACLQAPCDYSWPLWPGGVAGTVFYKCDMKHVHFEQASFLGKVFLIPSPALPYLKQNYGEDWDNPKGGVYKNCDFRDKKSLEVDTYQDMVPPASYVLKLMTFFEATHPNLATFEVTSSGELMTTEPIPQ